MEINGTDHRFEVLYEFDPDIIVDTIAKVWANSVVEDDIDDNSFFIYKDAASKASWDEKGWTEANDDTMIQVIVDGNQVTMVIDNHSKNKDIVTKVQEVINASFRN